MKYNVFKSQGSNKFRHWNWQKKKVVLIALIVFVIFFFCRLFFFMSQLTNTQKDLTTKDEEIKIMEPLKSFSIDVTNVFNSKGLIRGIRLKDLVNYKPDSKGMFTCIKSRKQIDFNMVNDDYCDCPEDGSDEPGTNACNEGHFYCSFQPKHGFSRNILVIPSSRVNDGICDCCDGSDEWNRTFLLLKDKNQKSFSVCPNVCVSS